MRLVLLQVLQEEEAEGQEEEQGRKARTCEYLYGFTMYGERQCYCKVELWLLIHIRTKQDGSWSMEI